MHGVGYGEGAIIEKVESGLTVASDFFAAINRVGELLGGITAKAVVDGGDQTQRRSACEVIPLAGLAEALEQSERGP